MNRLMQLYDRWMRPVRRSDLTKEIAAASTTGVRSPLTGYPGDGLTPERLAGILREADQGDPIRYLELAETIEERDPHYLGVLGTRRRSVSQLDITVEEGDDSAKALEIADEMRSWLKRQELQSELFHILDAIGKGYSHTEIIWEHSQGDYWPAQLEYRDPRWFRFERDNLKMPVMLDAHGQEEPYRPFKFIYAQMQAKSGLPARSGLARAVLWCFLFKAYTQRDWAIFTQTYGQPLRVGKYGAGASEDARDTLFRAVANIGGDCAAIIPDSMLIEFVQTGNLGSSTDHYENRCNFLDMQVSKAVLGQTATTDAVTGGLGSGKEHRQVQEDIETADANELGAILTRDLAIPFVQLTHGPQPNYPQIKIGRPKEEDLEMWANAIAPMIDRGLAVSEEEVRTKFGTQKPEQGDRILRPQGVLEPLSASYPNTSPESAPTSAVKRVLNTQVDPSGIIVAEQAEGVSEGHSDALSELSEKVAREALTGMDSIMAQIEAMLAAATSLEEFQEMLLAAGSDLDASEVAAAITQGMTIAELTGRLDQAEQSDG